MSEDSDEAAAWAEYATTLIRRGTVTRRDLERMMRGLEAEQKRKAAERRWLDQQDRDQWIEGIRSRLGLVTEVHEYRVWQVGENWWAWECQRSGCWYSYFKHASSCSATSKARAVAAASAHRRGFLPVRPEAVAGAGLDLTGWGPQA